METEKDRKEESFLLKKNPTNQLLRKTANMINNQNMNNQNKDDNFIDGSD